MNKEQYLALVASWKAFINEGKHKKYKKYYDYFDLNSVSMENGKLVSWTTYKNYGYSWQSDLTATHHLIYTLVRKRDVSKRFSDESVKDILISFRNNINYWNVQYRESVITKILEPFNGNISIEEVKQLFKELVEVKNLRISL